MRRARPGRRRRLLPARALQDASPTVRGDPMEIGLPVHMLPHWYDVDDAETLRMLGAELFEAASFAQDLHPNRAHHTRTVLQSLFEGSDLHDRLGRALQRAAE